MLQGEKMQPHDHRSPSFEETSNLTPQNPISNTNNHSGETEKPSERITKAEEENYKNYENGIHEKLTRTAFESIGKSNNVLSLFIDPNEFKKPPYNRDESNVETESNPNNTQDAKAIELIRQLIEKNILKSGRQYRNLVRELEIAEILYKAIEDQENKGKPGTITRTELGDYYASKIEEIKDKIHELSLQNPESYTIVNGFRIREWHEEIKKGDLVKTPYTQRIAERVERNLEHTRHSFIYGPPGTGKTELAMNVARTFLIEQSARKEALKESEIYAKNNPNTTFQERQQYLGRIYRENKKQFEQAYYDGDETARKMFSPLFVPGSNDLTTADLYQDKTLRLSTPNEKTYTEHLNEVKKLEDEWREKHPNASQEDIANARQRILEIYKLKNHQAFGTEVATIIRPLYQGIKEGKPVVIDEINSIPAGILISLNDLLTKKPGQSCNIPGVGPVEIHPGFAVIATGNLSSESVNYHGTNELNPALLSRFDVFEYNYLPMSIEDPSFSKQYDRKKNELFHVAIAHLVDKKGHLQLPDMEDSLDKIFALCQLASETQLIYENRLIDKDFGLKSHSGDKITVNLDDSVISIRNLLNIIDAWHRGRNGTIDQALWNGYISTLTNADDQNLIIALARRHNFFSDSEGWKINIKGKGGSLTSLEEVHPDPFFYKIPPLETHSIRRVVEDLFGPGPRRQFWPDIDLDKLEQSTDNEDDANILDSVNKLQELLHETTEYINGLRTLHERAGCEWGGNNNNKS